MTRKAWVVAWLVSLVTMLALLSRVGAQTTDAPKGSDRTPQTFTVEGKVNGDALAKFLHDNFVPTKQKPATERPAYGMCGAWGCPLVYAGRTIKGCSATIDTDGDTKIRCYY